MVSSESILVFYFQKFSRKKNRAIERSSVVHDNDLRNFHWRREVRRLGYNLIIRRRLNFKLLIARKYLQRRKHWKIYVFVRRVSRNLCSTILNVHFVYVIACFQFPSFLDKNTESHPLQFGSPKKLPVESISKLHF